MRVSVKVPTSWVSVTGMAVVKVVWTKTVTLFETVTGTEVVTTVVTRLVAVVVAVAVAVVAAAGEGESQF